MDGFRLRSNPSESGHSLQRLRPPELGYESLSFPLTWASLLKFIFAACVDDYNPIAVYPNLVLTVDQYPHYCLFLPERQAFHFVSSFSL
jgi:hypothetical protein